MDADFTQVKNEGLYYKDKLIANAVFQVKDIYTDAQTSVPSQVALEVTVSHLPSQTVLLPISALTYKDLYRRIPLLVITDSRSKSLLGMFLSCSIVDTMQSRNTGQPHLYFRENGCHRLSDGTWLAIEGCEVIGGNVESLTPPRLQTLKIACRPAFSPAIHILTLLKGQSGALLLLLSYTLCTLVRSAILESGIDFHAVAWLFGGQGFGKSTAAKRTSGFIVNSESALDRPALLFDCSSRIAAVREAFTIYRDLPIILDDVCFSAGKLSQERRTELAAQIIREASNATAILKMRQGEQVCLECKAGVIITSEFTFGSASDVTRCIMMKLSKPLALPDEYNIQLSGTVAKVFLKRFTGNAQKYLHQLKMRVANSTCFNTDCPDTRIRTNLAVLQWCFDILLEVAAEEGLSTDESVTYHACFNQALEESLTVSTNYLSALSANRASGNLAYILLCGFQNEEFKLVTSPKKIEKHLVRNDGVYLADNKAADFLCLRRPSLLTFVKRQPGYRNYTMKKITDELSFYGALSTNEAGTYQVKLSSNPNVPRVYRISLRALEAAAKKY